MKLKFKKLRNVKTPTYDTTGAACFDFYVPDDIEYKLMKGYDTGIKVPLGLERRLTKAFKEWAEEYGLNTSAFAVLDSDLITLEPLEVDE